MTEASADKHLFFYLTPQMTKEQQSLDHVIKHDSMLEWSADCMVSTEVLTSMVTNQEDNMEGRSSSVNKMIQDLSLQIMGMISKDYSKNIERGMQEKKRTRGRRKLSYYPRRK